ncbi:MAG: hypothetical protein AVDCRST_MAG55-1652, partial [uncultured Rubrobacteraceae bacterium]
GGYPWGRFRGEGDERAAAKHFTGAEPGARAQILRGQGQQGPGGHHGVPDRGHRLALPGARRLLPGVPDVATFFRGLREATGDSFSSEVGRIMV